MREYTFEKYINATERHPNPILKKQMDTELKIINSVISPKKKTFIDMGAGHGRLTPNLAPIARNVISVEINPDMLPELNRRSSRFNNSIVVIGDMTKLSSLLEKRDVINPVLLLVQNTIGTIEGSPKKVLSEMKKVATKYKGEIIISFFRSESLKSWGLKLYSSSTLKVMVGESDMTKNDFKKGLFVSKTGYTSQWRNKEEIEQIKSFFGAKVLHEIWTDEWCVLHIAY
jgi:SAM-dependent methyltransferase